MSERPPRRWVRRRFRRFVVADRSMEPAVRAGQGLIAVCSARARVGQLRCVEHPDRPGFWLVKRVTAVPTPDTMWVSSDNADVSTVDSEQLGLLPVRGSWRVVVRVPLRLM